MMTRSWKLKFWRFFRSFHRTNWKSHSITESKDASRLPQMQGTIIHHRDKTQYSFYFCASHRCPFQKFIRQPLENIIQGCKMSKNHFCGCASSFHAEKLVAMSVTRLGMLSSSGFWSGSPCVIKHCHDFFFFGIGGDDRFVRPRTMMEEAGQIWADQSNSRVNV
jgi:hypothetical protein